MPDIRPKSIPVIAKVSDDQPVTKEYFERILRTLLGAVHTDTHMDVFSMLGDGYKTMVFSVVGWELNRVLDETGEVEKKMWDIFVASVEYLTHRDGMRLARHFRRIGGSALLDWMRRADTDEKKREIIRAVVPANLRRPA